MDGLDIGVGIVVFIVLAILLAVFEKPNQYDDDIE